MSKFLTPDERLSLVDAHCQRVVNNMEAHELLNYAKRMMAESFDQHPGCGDVDEARLLTDMYIAESEDLDSVEEFLIGAGIDTATVNNIINNYQF